MSQEITFKYQQEGTAKGFNKLLTNVIPTGIIKGGELSKVDDVTVKIDDVEMMIGDGNVVVHAQITSLNVTVSQTNVYIVAKFDWVDSSTNEVKFLAISSNLLNTVGYENCLILGRCIYDGNVLSINFDYTCKTWSPIKLNNDLELKDYTYNDFNVTPDYVTEKAFYVGEGKAIINGKTIEINQKQHIVLSDTTADSTRYIVAPNSERTDIAILTDEGNIEYIMGESNVQGRPPICPSNALLLAEFRYPASTSSFTYINGNYIHNIYHNNFMSFAPTFGKMEKGTLINEHTLYI